MPWDPSRTILLSLSMQDCSHVTAFVTLAGILPRVVCSARRAERSIAPTRVVTLHVIAYLIVCPDCLYVIPSVPVSNPLPIHFTGRYMHCCFCSSESRPVPPRMLQFSTHCWVDRCGVLGWYNTGTDSCFGAKSRGTDSPCFASPGGTDLVPCALLPVYPVQPLVMG